MRFYIKPIYNAGITEFHIFRTASTHLSPLRITTSRSAAEKWVDEEIKRIKKMEEWESLNQGYYYP